MMPFKPTFVAALLTATFVIAGCDRRPTDPPQPKALTTAGQSNAPVPPAPVTDPSLPPASAALTAPTTVASAPATRQDVTLSRPMESAAMPVGGQNNDHSAPKPYEPGASGAGTSAPR